MNELKRIPSFRGIDGTEANHFILEYAMSQWAQASERQVLAIYRVEVVRLPHVAKQRATNIDITERQTPVAMISYASRMIV
jgi:hypothetical protein